MILLAIAGLLALTLCIGCLVALHLVPSGVQPARDPVSLYGTTRYSILYRIQVIASGISALMTLLILDLSQDPFPLIGLILLSCYGIARMLIAGFMMDKYDVSPTASGRIHIVLGIIAFASIAAATGLLTDALTDSSYWYGLNFPLSLASDGTITAAVLFVLTSLLPPLKPITGLVERAIYLGALCWLGLVLVPLIR